jgi:hypothetical protein
MTTQSEARKAHDRLQNAFECFASESAGSGHRDYQLAREYREEGYRLGEEAAEMPEEDRDDWLDEQVYAFDESARDLIWAAARATLADLCAEDAVRARADKFLAMAADIVGVSK